jgi:hypothetical protein
MKSADPIARHKGFSDLQRRAFASTFSISIVGIRKKEDSEAEKDSTKQNQPVLVGFTLRH